MKSSYLLILIFALSNGLSAGQIATGFVYHDINSNNTFDDADKGIQGVLVSNGTDVVATDEDGGYSLEVGEDTILFVIQPKGWRVPVNDLNLPQFYYIHKPAGSPVGLEYAGVAPTGLLPESVDFPLYPSDIGESFSIFAFGDPQPYTEQDANYYKRDIVEEARHIVGPVAGVTLGDIVGDDLDLYTPVNQATALMGLPWWHVYGNHDMNFDAEDPEMTDETFEAVYGPATYAFQIGNVVFIAIDNVLYPNTYTDSFYTGGFTDKQLSFVGNLLKHVPEENLVVTMVHIPLYDEMRDTFIDEHREAFFKLFKNHKFTLSLSAHTHTQNHYFFDAEHDHWPHLDAPHHHYNVGTTSGSWWAGEYDERGIPVTTMRDGVPNGYAIIHFDGNEYIYDWKVANGPEDEVMSIYLPLAVKKTEGWSNAGIGVNVYNGSEQAKVEYRINDGEWREASRWETVDPNYAFERFSRAQTETPTEGRLLPFPSVSSHQWIGRLPINLELGTQTVDVRVTDRFGRVFTASDSYEIVE
jgi:hypothetical protein